MNILYSERVGLPTLSFVIGIITEVQMANKTEIKALEIGEPIAQQQSVYIVYVSYKKDGETYSLCYYI